MKKFFLFLYRLAFWISIPVYIICSLSSYLPASVCFFTDALALAFPFALALQLLVLLAAVILRRKLALVALIVLLTGYRNIGATIAFHPFAGTVVPDNSTLKVMSWNVFFFVDDLEHRNDSSGSTMRKMLQLIGESKADVLCMQEYHSIDGSPSMVSVHHLLDSMGYKYSIFSGDNTHKHRGGISVHGTMLFSKLPLVDSGRTFLTTEHAVYGDVLFQGKKLRIYSAHLSSLGLYADTANKSENVYEITYERKGSVARKIKHIALAHEREAAILDSSFRAGALPVIFCADMNAVPATRTYHIVRGDMQDAFLSKGFGLGYTYYGLSPTLRIDVCFADKQLEVAGCRVIYDHLSDHYPVLTHFRWK